jgi:uncharacterized membrane protein YeaQ/YmgE (transglycosylase-associated protein family)
MNYLFAAQVGFILLSIISLILIYIQLKKSSAHLGAEIQKRILRKYSIGLSLWFLFVSILALLGVFADFTSIPLRLPFALMFPFILLFFFLRFKHLDSILAHTPPQWFFNIQFFRFFVEILLWFLFLAHSLPERMTFEGYNFDIIAGITGPIFAYLCFAKQQHRKWLAILWNVVGLLLLLNIVSIALMTMPTPLQVFQEDNTIIGAFPFALLPTILVPIAYYMHVLSLRQLLQSS